MRNWIIFGLCVLLALAVFLAGGGKTVFSQEGERQERQHDGVSVAFKDTPVDDAIARIAEMTGLNVILPAGMAQHYADQGTMVTLRLKNVGNRQAIRALAHSLQLRADIDDNMVFFKWVPQPAESTIIGKLVLKEKNFELELNIYQGEISGELKQHLINQMIENNAHKMRFETIKLRKGFEKMERGGFDGDRERAIKEKKAKAEKMMREKKEWLENEKGKREKAKQKGDEGNEEQREIF
ncbi:hypothetical protein ACFL4W_04840 [Planctomycetota bacterium]